MRDAVHLTASADRLGGSLPGLQAVLDGPLGGLFGGVHVLPFFAPYNGADAGFYPEDHLEVDFRLGSWDDVRELARGRDLVVDVIVNHVSARSPQFRDVAARGDASPSAGMFLTLGAVFPDGASEADLLRIVRPRPGLPFTPVTVGGERRLAWTTFTSEQMDIDVGHPETRRYLRSVLTRLAGAGVTTVRLDAVGYAVKTPGTSCFMTPETFAFIGELSAEARELGLEVLVEIHAPYELQLEVARQVDWVYDFALPALVLHGLVAGEDAALRRWLDVRPANAINVLDTHDGIGVVDVVGLLDEAQIDALVEAIHANSGGASRLATGAAASNVDLYQVNCTYFDALGGDEARYLLARALQLFVPGIPQIYYVGLLAGGNDTDRLARTGVGRDINRHAYTAGELAAALERPVVRALTRLIALRNAHPAFRGRPRVLDGPPGTLGLEWRAGEELARLEADLVRGRARLTWTQEGRERAVADLAEFPGS